MATWIRSNSAVTTWWYRCSHMKPPATNTVGIRELKAHLSRHLRRVRSGTRLVVTERGRAIASITPVETPRNVEWAHALVASGRAQWGGGKPEGVAPPVRVNAGKTVSEAVLEDRR